MSSATTFALCVRGQGLPVPELDDLKEAKEFIELLHSAWESAGAGEELTIGGLIAAGAALGLDEATLAVLSEAAEIAVTAYIAVCLGCLASVGVEALRDLFASNAPQPFMSGKLLQLGVDLNAGVATA